MMIVKAQYESQTVRIDGSENDGFVTESGIMWADTDLIHVLDPNMEIVAFLMFENIEINSYEVLNNATLRLRTASSQPADPDSNVWIYGVKQQNFLGFFSPADVTGAIRTFAFVNYNTSAFSGPSWKEIDVTDIVSELINNPGWDGDDIGGISDNIGFVIRGPDGGYDTRYFYDEIVGNGLEAQLVINWGDAPPDPTPSPGDPPLPPGDPDPEVNETYREYVIWEVDHNGPNRTGEGLDLSWNSVNMSELTEIDSGGVLTLNNDTWLTVTNLQAQQWDSMYNDSGGGIDTAFLRCAINISAVTNNLGAGSDRVYAVTGISTNSPVGGGGLADGGAGDWAGIVIYIAADDSTWRFRLMERSGAAVVLSPSGLAHTEGDGNIYYVEFLFYDDGPQNYLMYRIYLDPEFTVLHELEVYTLTVAAGPMRYPQLSSSLAAGLSRITNEFYTFLDFELAENSTWIVTDENGTIIVQGLDDYEDAIDWIEELLGPDPQDPDPPLEDWPQTGPFQRFRARLYILIIGIGMVFGPLFFWSMSRPSGYEFTIGSFIMLIGFALMYAAGQV